MIKEVNEDYLKESIENSKKPIFVDFHALWCGPCRMANPLLEEISNKYSEEVDFYKVDVDKNRFIAADFGVKNIPFFIMIEDGQVTRKLVGAPDREKLEKFIAGE